MKVNWGGEECTGLQMLRVGVEHRYVGDPFSRKYYALCFLFHPVWYFHSQFVNCNDTYSPSLGLGGRWRRHGILLHWYKLRLWPKCELYGSQHSADSHGNVQALMKRNNFLCLHHFVFSQWTKYFQEPSSVTWQPAEDSRRVETKQTEDNPTSALNCNNHAKFYCRSLTSTCWMRLDNFIKICIWTFSNLQKGLCGRRWISLRVFQVPQSRTETEAHHRV